MSDRPSFKSCTATTHRSKFSRHISTQASWASGIYIIGGQSGSLCAACVSGNMVENIRVLHNEVAGYKYGMQIIGGKGVGACKNQVNSAIDRFLTKKSGHVTIDLQGLGVMNTWLFAFE